MQNEMGSAMLVEGSLRREESALPPLLWAGGQASVWAHHGLPVRVAGRGAVASVVPVFSDYSCWARPYEGGTFLGYLRAPSFGE